MVPLVNLLGEYISIQLPSVIYQTKELNCMLLLTGNVIKGTTRIIGIIYIVTITIIIKW